MIIAIHPIIGVVGTKEFNEFLPYENIAEKIGEEIARKNYWLLCGGTTGVMEAAPRGAKKLGGLTIGILPRKIADINDENKGKEWPSSHIDIAIFTGLGGDVRKRNIEGGYTPGRNVVIVNSCDAIIALPGSNQADSGTRSEIDFAVQSKVPVILHRYWEKVSNPDPILESGLLVQYYDTAEEAVEKAIVAIEQRAHISKLTTSRR